MFNLSEEISSCSRGTNMKDEREVDLPKYVSWAGGLTEEIKRL